MRFHEQLTRVTDMLQSRGKVSYRALKLELELDDESIGAISDELVEVLGIAVDRDGRFLEWIRKADTPSTAGPQRRQLTVMFCDMVGATQMSGELDPEDLRDIITAYQAACSSAVERFEGHIAQYLGDGILVYFGWPRAHEDDVQHAVNAGLGIIDGVAALGDDLERRGLPRVQVRVGIHTGPVVVGQLGSAGHQETLALGETPNISARVQAAASPGDLLISEGTHRIVEGFFDEDDLGEQTLKGINRPIRLFRIKRAARAKGRLEASAARGLSPLVNRDTERAALADAWAGAKRGERRTIVLSGEAGIGKSRLRHFTLQSLATGDRHVFECRCSAYHKNTALYALSVGIRGAWALDETGDPLARISAVVGQYKIVDSTVATPLMAMLAGVALSPEQMGPVAGWTPQRQRGISFSILSQLLRAEAGQRPVIFFVEDLHWADPSTLEFVQSLLDTDDLGGVLVLMTARPSFISPWEEREDVGHLRLERLEPKDIVKLVRATSGGATLDDKLVTRLSERTDGNPLFIEELTRTVVESRDHGTEDSIPDSLHSALLARLDHLKVARPVAEMGAALGRTFPHALIRAVIGLDDSALEAGLDELVKAQILIRRRTGGETEYSFKHALIQDAALDSVLRTALRGMHRTIADTIVARFPDVAASQPQRVAHHYEESGQYLPAVEWYRKAGEAGIMRSANAEAIVALSRALELTQKLAVGPVRSGHELVLRVLHAVPLTMTRGWAAPEVGAQYQRAQELCDEVGDTPQLFPTLVGVLTYYIVRGQFTRAAEMAVRNLEIAQNAGVDELILEAEHDRGTTLFYLGQPRACLPHLERCESIYDPRKHHSHAFMYGKDPKPVAQVHQALSHALMGNERRAVELSNAAVAHTEQWIHPFSHLWALCGVASVQKVLGHPLAAFETAQMIVTGAEAQGYPNWLAQGLCYLGHGLTHAGKHEEGIGHIAQGLGIWGMTGANLLTPFLQWMMADAQLLRGSLEAADAALDTALELIETTQERWFLPEILRTKGLVLERSDGYDAARPWYQRALDDARGRGAELLAARAQASLANGR